MKKISTIVMALLMVVAMSQCKKNEQNASDNQGEAVTITLDVKNGNDSKVIVNPTTGTVDFENGDQIIVASGGKYVGTLTYNGNLFTGAISNATEGYPLQFYFLGNVTPAETLTSGVTESCSVVISDQTQHLPVISAAPSYENYTASMTNYTANLLNKCALVKFNVSTTSEAAICVTGFNNKVTVNFMDNTLTNSQEGNGVITLPAGNGEKWAILLPQEALEAGEQGSAYSQDGVYTGTRGAVPAITANGYLTLGIQVMVTNSGEVPVGAINGLFTINSNGDQVYFSKGNLQYIGSAGTPYWKFAENQWDYIGNNQSVGVNIDRDLFSWGTSGYNHGANHYFPWSTGNDDGDYYAYGSYQYNLFDQTGQADWGYNPINNGGNIENIWRTLKIEEWNYILFLRNTLSSIRFTKAQVNGVNGVVILPDNWEDSFFTLNNTNDAETAYDNNVITDWNSLQLHGAVFLPAAGDRDGEDVVYVNVNGHYWSSTYDNAEGSRRLAFTNNSLETGMDFRYHAFSVRLVQDKE